MAGTAPASSSINNAGDGATGGSKSKLGHGQQSADTSSLKRKRGLFSKDLRLMMYGFGDDPDVQISSLPFLSGKNAV
jgi:hypothetical protein